MDQPRKKLTLSTKLSPQTRQKLALSVKLTPQQQQQVIIKEKEQRKNKIKAALNWLLTQYPLCFNYTMPRPLKLRIENDIIADIDRLALLSSADMPSKKAVREAIAFYSRNLNYIKAHLTHPQRIDLQGIELSDQPLTDAQRDYATQAVVKIKAVTTQKTKLRKKRKPKDEQAAQLSEVQSVETHQSSLTI